MEASHSHVLRGRRDAGPYKAAACFPPFPSPSGRRWHPPIPREADDGRGRTRPFADSEIVRIFPQLRSFPHCGPATFSLSGRPCGRHPPPLGEGMGEGAFDELNGPSHPKRFHVGRADLGAPRSSTRDESPPPGESAASHCRWLFEPKTARCRCYAATRRSLCFCFVFLSQALISSRRPARRSRLPRSAGSAPAYGRCRPPG